MKVVASRFFVPAICVASLLTVACGGSASLSPVAPSASGSLATSNSAASISGQVNTVTTAPLTARTFQMQDAHAITISVVGTGISTTANTQGQFTLNNVPAGAVALNFSGPGGANATITISDVGPTDQVQITVTLNGSSAHVDSEHHSSSGNNNNDNGETVGTIATIDTTAKSFTITGFTVTTSTSTTIRHGDTTVAFSSLKAGDHVQVRGTKTGTTIAATEIKVETPEGDDNESGDHPPTTPTTAELSGTVASLTGTCPAITFTLSTTKVTTTSATTFDHTTCSAITNGAKVEVEGTKQTDGSITATKVSLDSQGNDAGKVDVSGVVASLTGTCPAITFTVSTTKVTTTTTTTFDHGCSSVKNGVKVEVQGTKQTDGSIAATKVSLDD